MASTMARPRKLRDFLNDNPDSCSSTGFKSFRLNSKVASTRISAFQAVINAVKKLPFTTVKSHSIFPRSLSRRLSRKHGPPSQPREIKITVRVKDIVRWPSFRDLLEEKSRPSDFASSPHHCTTTTGSTSTTCSSNGSSWCESDFTSEYLPPSWGSTSQEYGETEVHLGKKYLQCVGRNYVEAASVAPEVETTTTCDEKEQQSPVSVLDFQDGDNKDPFSSFTRSLAGVERTRQNLMQKIQQFENLAKLEPFDLEEWMSLEENTRFEEEEEEEEEENEIEKNVRELLNDVKATSSVDIGKAKVEKLLFDFFSDELMSSKRCQCRKDDDDDDDEFNCEMVSMAKAWMKGDHNGLHEWGIEHKKEAYVSEMDGRERWSSFEEEQEKIALEIETRVLGCLMDEVLVDLFLHR